MTIELLYGFGLIAAIVVGTLSYKNHWKMADYF